MNIKEIIELHEKWVNNIYGGLRADLSEADLSEADLRGADLSEADLRGADLRGADLRGADLRGADLSGADLSGADLRGADLLDANLTEAILPETLLFIADESLISKVAKAALSSPTSLRMNYWHTCQTTHCIAGWAIYLHPDGNRLAGNSSEYMAGRLLLGDEAAGHFFDSNEEAKQYLSNFLK